MAVARSDGPLRGVERAGGEAVLRFASALFASSDLTELEQRLVTGFGRLFHAPMYAFYILDPLTGRPGDVAPVNVSETFLARYERLPQGRESDPMHAHVLATGEAAYNLALMSSRPMMSSGFSNRSSSVPTEPITPTASASDSRLSQRSRPHTTPLSPSTRSPVAACRSRSAFRNRSAPRVAVRSMRREHRQHCGEQFSGVGARPASRLSVASRAFLPWSEELDRRGNRGRMSLRICSLAPRTQ
jgi:hypothetical protein